MKTSNNNSTISREEPQTELARILLPFRDRFVFNSNLRQMFEIQTIFSFCSFSALRDDEDENVNVPLTI